MRHFTSSMMLALILVITLSGCNTSKTSSSTTDSDQAVTKPDKFTDWREVTSGVRVVGSQEMMQRFFLFCRTVSEKEVERAAKDSYGQHALRYTQVYANPDAWKAIDGKRPWRFAVGSIIVKQKLEQKDTKPSARAQFAHVGRGPKPAGVGVMIKREPGYAPDDGDWQYLYFEGDQKPVTDLVAAKSLKSLKNCAACHNQAAKQDYVYLPFLSKTKPAKR